MTETRADQMQLMEDRMAGYERLHQHQAVKQERLADRDRELRRRLTDY